MRPHLLLLYSIAVVFFSLLPARADLAGYVNRPDASFAWKQEKKETTPEGTIYMLSLTSQTWQGIVWKHRLLIYQPNGAKPPSTLTLLNTGGGPGPQADLIALTLAKKINAPLAVLYDIPNQPLFDGKHEDGLIAETFLRYLKTGDSDWPLLLPMVKSVTKAMDALQAWSKDEWKSPVKDFIVTGASKRGWTSWLTAASGDKRVKAIAPMVIDTLNMAEQTRHQKESYGALSEEIGDYSKNGLTELSNTPKGKALLALVDPYSYRKMLTLPKLILNGANDPYWSADSLRLYWDDLPGEKWVAYIPNAGHNLAEKRGDGVFPLERAFNVLAAFIRSQSGGAKLATLKWKETEKPGEPYRLTLDATEKPRAVRLWVAHSATKDFRPSEWEATVISLVAASTNITPSVPEKGYLACFAESEFGSDGATYTLCTPVKVLGGK